MKNIENVPFLEKNLEEILKESDTVKKISKNYFNIRFNE